MSNDSALTGIKALVSAVPGLGGPIATLISDYAAKSAQDSMEAWLRSLGRRLESLEDRIDAEAVDKDAFAELFFVCRAAVLRSRQAERHRAAADILANLLLKDGDSDKLDYEELHHFARCLEDLSRGALATLGIAYRRAFTSDERLERESRRLMFVDISSELPNLEVSLVMGLIAELDRMNLLHRPGAPSVRDPGYRNYSIELTPLGARFVRYVLEPEHPSG